MERPVAFVIRSRSAGVMDTTGFYAAYREDGHGRAAYEPSMMLALLLYCWSRGVRSSRAIECACVEDVACRVIAAHQQPDHATIARFVERHEQALAGLFGDAKPIPRSRPQRLLEGKRRLEEELAVERAANEQYEAYRKRGVMKDGRRFGRPPNPRQLPTTPTSKVNLTDPDSRRTRSARPA
jgi:hypothetical protein